MLLAIGRGRGVWHISRVIVRVLGLPTFSVLCNPVGTFETSYTSRHVNQSNSPELHAVNVLRWLKTVTSKFQDLDFDVLL